MNNPCFSCSNSKTYRTLKKDFYKPSNNVDCNSCEKRIKYEAYKENRRMFKEGKPFTSINDFIEYKQNNNYVYWYGKLMHIAAIESWQFRLVEKATSGGWLHKAILKESEDNKEQNE